MTSDPFSSSPSSHDMEASASSPVADEAAQAISSPGGVADGNAPAVDAADAAPEAASGEAAALAPLNMELAHGIASFQQDAAPNEAEVRPEPIATTVDARPSRSGDALAQFNAKIVEATRANLDATFALWSSLVGVKSLSEAVELNTQHMRKQIEMLTTQGRELSSLAQKLVRNSVN